MQGTIGDCWLLAAIATIADFAVDFFSEYVFVNKGVSPVGHYTLRLFDVSSGSWRFVTVDDRIPCHKADWFLRPTPIFAHTAGHELYVLLIEKASPSDCALLPLAASCSL